VSATDLTDRVAQLERDLAARDRELEIVRGPFDQMLVAYFNIAGLTEPAFHELLDRVLFLQRPSNRDRMQFNVIDRAALDLPSVKKLPDPEEKPGP
jgi:hypothetical protein